MFPLWSVLLDVSIVFLDVGPFILFLVFPFGGGGEGGRCVLVYLWLAGYHSINLRVSTKLIGGITNKLTSTFDVCFWIKICGH
jgi:hypothetical protein